MSPRITEQEAPANLPHPPSPAPAGSGRSTSILSRLRRLPLAEARFGGIYLWLLFIVVFTFLAPDTFLTWTTAKSIASDQAITIILACGLLFTLAGRSYDLSFAQNLGMTTIILATLLSDGTIDPAVAVALGVAIGIAIGLLNGFLVAVVGVDSFITTLGVSSVLLAVTELISHGTFVGPVSQSFQGIVKGDVLGIPTVTVYAIVVALLAWWILEHTPYGRRNYATGSSPEAARLSGIPVKAYVFGSFVITGAISGIAAVLLLAKVGTVSPDIGPPYLLPVFAACFLGTTQLKVGRFNVAGTVLAVLLLATGVKGIQLAGGSELWVTSLFNGVALVGAVSVAVLAQKRRDSKLKSEASEASHVQ